jgi:enterochelin esterase-like enzyme
MFDMRRRKFIALLGWGAAMPSIDRQLGARAHHIGAARPTLPPLPSGNNLIQSPNDITAAAWALDGVTAAHTTGPAPEGTPTVTHIVETATSGLHAFSQSFAHSGGARTYVLTADVKSTGRSLFMQFADGNRGIGSGFILVGAGSIFSPDTFGARRSILDQSIRPVAQGFYRISIRVISSAAAKQQVQFLLFNAANMATYAGDGVQGIEICNVHLAPSAPLSAGTFHVAANGNDSGDASEANPWRTIDTLNAHLFAPGSSILFRGGDVFVGNFKPNIAGGGSQASPVIIGSYGTGRATIHPAFGGETGIINIEAMSGITVQDLILAAPDLTKMPRGGVRIGNNSGNRNGGYIIQRNDISGIRYGQTKGDFGGEIFIEGSPGTGGIENIVIKNNNFHGLSGITSRDDMGVGGFGGQPILNMTQVGNLVYHIGASEINPITNNVSFPPMGDGLDFNSITNVVAKYNIVHDNAANYDNTSSGPCAFLSTNSSGCVWRFNEGYNIQPAVTLVAADFVGLDMDNGTSGSLAEFNYMHDNYNSGFMFFSNGNAAWNNNTIRKNLSVNNCKAGISGFGEYTITIPGGNVTLHLDNNVGYNDRVYNGRQFGTLGQGNAALAINQPGNFNGSISNNVGVISQDIYGLWTPINARTNGPYSNPVTVSGNQWFGRNGGSINFWWGPTQYSSLSGWQFATGKSGNGAAAGSSPNIFPTTSLGLSSAERTLCVNALTAIQGIPGIDIVGSRAAALAQRLSSVDAPITLPEYIALGFALTRMDTSASTALLARLEPIMLGSEPNPTPNGVPYDGSSYNNDLGPGAYPANITHGTYFSSVVNAVTGYCIYLPPEHATNPNQRFNVIYFLTGQGYGSGATENSEVTTDPELISNLRLIPPTIMVFPNPYQNSKYMDAAPGTSMFGIEMFESQFINELVPFIDANYRTRASRGGRAIMGFSGGGQGALRVAFKYPALFSSVEGMSSAVDDNASNVAVNEPQLLAAMFNGDANAFDAQTANGQARANRANIISSGLAIHMSVGSADALLPNNQALDALLTSLGIPHDPLEVITGGAHDPRMIFNMIGPAPLPIY